MKDISNFYISVIVLAFFICTIAELKLIPYLTLYLLLINCCLLLMILYYNGKRK